MNTITVTGKGSFDDTVLQSGKIERRLGLISDELPTDTLTFYVYKQVAKRAVQYLLDKNMKPLVSSDGKFLMVRRSGGGTIDAAKPGDNVTVSYKFPSTDPDYPNAEVKLGQFVIDSIEVVYKLLYKFTCVSYLGILEKSVHAGGIYSAQNAKALIQEIMTPVIAHGFTFSVDSALPEDELYGWLPYGNSKDNLLHVLFATGWIIRHYSNNALRLTTPGRNSPHNTGGNTRTYFGDALMNLDNAGEVRLIEHGFYQSATDIEKTLFDNTNDISEADHLLVIFDEPCYAFGSTGTIVTDGDPEANWAIVSGRGTLTGYVYTHTQRQLTAETQIMSDNIVSVENETLVTLTNSKNVLARLVNLQNANHYAKVDFRPIPLSNEFPNVGDELLDWYTGISWEDGYIQGIDYNMSANPKITADVRTGFTPGPYGMSINQYVFRQYGDATTWKVPEGVTEVMAVLIGGGEGGQGGFNGDSGSDGTEGYSGDPGEGGDGGVSGLPGKVNTVTFSVTPGQTISINYGIGGFGGARNGSFGDSGTDTEITVGGVTYSSADGSIPPNGYENPLGGERVANEGSDGDAGGWGGTYHDSEGDIIKPQGVEPGKNGSRASRTSPEYHGAYGGGGGGGVGDSRYVRIAGEDGENGIVGTWTMTGGDGGKGASAADMGANSTCGDGGDGGHGGGGGGGGGGVFADSGDYSDYTYAVGYGGDGGQGGRGEDGGDGGVVFYYSTNS